MSHHLLGEPQMQGTELTEVVHENPYAMSPQCCLQHGAMHTRLTYLYLAQSLMHTLNTYETEYSCMPILFGDAAHVENVSPTDHHSNRN